MVIVIASQAGARSVEVAMWILRTGGNALDAVEAGVRAVEDDPKLNETMLPPGIMK